MTKGRFFDKVALIDQALESEGNISEALESIEDFLEEEKLSEYFFQRLESSDWLDPLLRSGYFSHPPAPIIDSDKGSIFDPPWPQSGYLARIAVKKPLSTLITISQIPETNNLHVHHDYARAALEMPVELAALLAFHEATWVNKRERIYFLLPEALGKLISKLAKGNQIVAALTLAHSLLALSPDPQTKKHSILRSSPEPKTRIESYQYENILKGNIPDLVEASGEQAFRLLCDLLEDYVTLQKGDAQRPDDYSAIWHPAIEDHEQNRLTSFHYWLVVAVRDAAVKIASDDPAKIPSIIEHLEDHGWHIFQRIAMHVLRVASDAPVDLIEERLLDRDRFEGTAVWHEYYLLLRDHFEHISPEGQQTILQWIEEGPDVALFKESFEKRTGKAATEEDVVKRIGYWQLEKLSAIRNVLPPGWEDRYDELTEIVEEPEHPDFKYYTSGGWAGPTSPKNASDLKAMSVEVLLDYLREWEPSGDSMSPSKEGLGRVLTDAVADNPAPYAEEAEQFIGQDPLYLHGLLRGFEEATKENRSFSWQPVIGLCRWIVQRPRDASPPWGWTRKVIPSLLGEGFKQGETVIPLFLREGVWEVLLPLTDDPEPDLKYEEEYGGSNMDPATMSINTVRGEAMHATIRYGLWIYRSFKQEPTKPNRGFDEMPEVRDVLEAHLDLDREPTLTVRAVYGQWIPWLILMDEEWARARLDDIFPREESKRHYRQAAWETYLRFCRPYDDTLEVLREEYRRAIFDLEATSLDTPDEREQRPVESDRKLAEHLMTFYLRGKLDLDDPNSLIRQFLARADDELRGYAVARMGRTLRVPSPPIDPEVFERIQAFRIEAATAAPKIPHSQELAAFGEWFASSTFDPEWAMTQLERTLDLAGKIEESHLVIERLATIAESMPLRAVQSLARILERDERNMTTYYKRDEIKIIISKALDSQDPEAAETAENLVHALGAKGLFEFRELLQKT